MNIHDKSSDDSAPRDSLAERLHREALAERQPFSPELHGQILRRIREDKPTINSPSIFQRTRLVAAAAAILLALAITFSIVARSRHASSPIAKNFVPLPTAPVGSQLSTSVSIPLNIGGEVSASLWPPQISLTLPSADQSSDQTPDLSEQQTPAFQDPAASAQAALAEVVPPNIRDLAYAIRDASRLLQ